MERYKIKKFNSDFIVNEVPLLPKFFPKNESSYTYLWFKKEGLTTFEAIDIFQKYFSLSFEDINVEGLKDEDGITCQITSFKKIISLKEILFFNKKYFKSITIERIMGYGKKPVLEKKLHGNQFNITLRSISETDCLKLKNFFEKNRDFSFINYYDSQRFGLPDSLHNTHKIGRAIIEKKWNKANKEYLLSGNKEVIDFNLLGLDSEAFAKITNLKKVSFYISSYHSFLWNESVSKYIHEKNKKFKKINIENIGNYCIPDKFDIPLPLNHQIDCLDIDFKKTNNLIKTNKRQLFINTAVYLLDTVNENKNDFTIEIAFFLPVGCYATMLVKQLFEQI